LSKHGMQDLVQEAIQDNQGTSALLANWTACRRTMVSSSARLLS
jgi:hypothetical protein